MNAPDTQVRIDGHYVGTAHPQTPLQLDTGLPVGTVTLSASASGYKSTERKIQLRNRKWVEASFSLTRKGPDPQEVLREQLATYRAHMETEHYTTGDGGTALPCYRAVLALDPDNQEAKDGLAQMARYYQKQAQAALAADALAKAEEKLEGLRQVDPDSPTAKTLEAKLKALRAGFEPEMVRVGGGCFQMGSPPSESGRDDDERQHRVCVDSFSIGEYEVTQAQWVAVMGSNPSRFSGCDRCPVERVSWNDVQDYIGKLNARSGKRYRLPTEAEWEYAARAGSTTAYPWGDAVGLNRANCDGCGSQWDGRRTAPVGSFRPNAWGLYDTVGNVWEWTCSLYDSSYGGAEQRCLVKNDARSRVNRGGFWHNGPRRVRSATRYRNGPYNRNNNLGLRLAQATRDPPGPRIPRKARACPRESMSPPPVPRREGSVE